MIVSKQGVLDIANQKWMKRKKMNNTSVDITDKQFAQKEFYRRIGYFEVYFCSVYYSLCCTCIFFTAKIFHLEYLRRLYY